MFEPPFDFSLNSTTPTITHHTEHNSCLARPRARTYAASKISGQEDFKHACLSAASLPPHRFGDLVISTPALSRHSF